MEADDFGLDLQNVKQRLLPGFGPRGQLPNGWQPWATPKPALPVDLFVKSLEHGSTPKLRTREALARFGACPYAIARRGIYLAAFHAAVREDLKDDHAPITSALKALSESIGPARETLDVVVRQLSNVLAAQEHHFDNDDELAGLRLRDEGDRLIAALSAIGRIEKPLAEIDQRRRAQKFGNVWRIAFAKSLFVSWWRLTDEDPSPATTSKFYGFLDDARSSLTDRDLPEVSWVSAVRTARSQARRDHGVDAPWRIEPS